MSKPLTALGRHILLELYDCPSSLLKEPTQSEQFLLEAAEKMGASVVSSDFHAFSPFGVSGVVIIKESHLTIHTWPEYQYAAIDIFTCGNLDVDSGLAYLKDSFQAERSWYKELERGVGVLNRKREENE